jgi:sec-independent protein translocase protein TatA
MIGDILQPTHLLFILVVALLVLGPKRLPEVGRSLGTGLRDFKAAINGAPDEPDEPDDEAPPGPAYVEEPPAPRYEPDVPEAELTRFLDLVGEESDWATPAPVPVASSSSFASALASSRQRLGDDDESAAPDE